MIIIDEIHNMRNMKSRYDSIYECVLACDKLILLTATPFFNTLRDFIPIINLLYRNDRILDIYRKYIIVDNYTRSLNNIAYMLRGKVSYINDKTSAYYPKVNLYKIELTMTRDFYNKYVKIIKIDKQFGKYPERFYNGYRQAVNILGESYTNQKLEKIGEIIGNNLQTLIFTNWVENGVNILSNFLEKMNITYGVITGKINPNKRMDIVEEYNNGIFQVLIITKAGSEGLDLKGTRNIIVLDPVWNPATLEQIIGRGSRYKSHFHLPISQRIVNVYLLILNSPRFAYVPSGDQLLYSILQEKEYIKNVIARVLAEISI